LVRIRIIPLTIAIAALMLGVRVMDMAHIQEAHAQAEAAPDKKPEAPAAAMAAAPDAKPEDKKPEEKAEAKDGKKEEGKPDKNKNPAVAEIAGETIERRYTPVEVELLQNLSRRRIELDRWEKNVEIKEATLNATEKRIDDKIGQIETMKKEVSQLLDQYNEKEDAKIRSLVKIYENMKSKDAARIFDEVEMPILLLVVDKMSEKKVAPILADMDPKKAKLITVQLAEQRKVSTSRLNSAPVPAGAQATKQ
jgi:flagellar motility protein MotE (MotC chaperone)